MLKNTILSLVLITTTTTLFAQDVKKDAEAVKTKMEAFISKTGAIIKLTDSKLPNLKTTYEAIETRIRKINAGSMKSYFYQIEKPGKYSNSIASIEYTDLLEVLKAIKTLKQEIDKDLSTNPDYLENKFATSDGFQVGYFVNKGKVNWFIKLEKFGSDNTLFIENGDYLETAFAEAKNKIDELNNH